MKNENPTSSSPDAEQAPKSPRRSMSNVVSLLLMLLLVGFAGWQWFDTRQQFSELRQVMAQGLGDADALAKSGAEGVRLSQENSTKLNERLNAVEAFLAESKEKEVAQEVQQQDLAKGRQALDLLQVEQAISLAVQQLQLASNVPVALLALRTADAQLARLDKARYLPLRKALAADIQRLSELPLVDLPGLSLQLEQIVESVDKFPFAAYGRPVDAASPALPDAATELEVKTWWQQALADFWHETRNLIRIQRFDHEEPVLLAPGQGFFLRENLKLRFLTARLALFARDQTTYQHELSLAQQWLTRHFLAEDKAVQVAQTQLNELVATNITIELPELRASQQALLALREAKDKP